MAHLWMKSTDGWDAVKLDGGAFDLVRVASAPPPENDGAGRATAQLVRSDGEGTKIWTLIASAHSSVRVNSRVVPAGIRVLAHGDEIRIGAEARYFSTETLAAIEPFPGADRPAYCGRCRQPIEIESPGVCCPGCGIWYHQDAELPCFTYTEKCMICGRATALDAGFTWVPEVD